MKENCVYEKVKKETKEIIKKYTNEKDQLITILNDIQEKYERKRRSTDLYDRCCAF